MICANERGLLDVRDLPHCGQNCYRWMLGACKPDPNDKRKCGVRVRNMHPTATQVPDDLAASIARILQPGVDKLVAANKDKRYRP